MDRGGILLVGVSIGAALVDRLADDVHDAAQHVSGPTGTMIGSPVSTTSWPRTRPSVDVHGDRADHVLAQVLGDLENQAGLPVVVCT